MNEQYRFIITSEQAGCRLDVFLAREIQGVSRSKLKKVIEAGGVTINGQREAPKYLLQTDDEVVVVFEKPKLPQSLAPDSSIPLSIVYEDDDFLVIDKQAGLVVQPDRRYPDKTLLNALLAHDPALADVSRCGLVHRLDREVSGLLVVGRSEKAVSYLKKQFQERHVEKKYVALVHGVVTQPAGEVRLPISRSRTNSRKMAAHPASSRQAEDKEALTQYAVQRRFQHYTLLEIRIITGRTHQIRVHLSALGYPLVGDSVYTLRKFPVKTDLGRIFLHAFSLTFRDMNGRVLKFQSELPKVLRHFLERLAPARS